MIMVRPLELRTELIVKAGALYETGLSTREVAKILGISKSTGALWVSKSGVTIDKNARISAKTKGRPSPLKGRKHSAHSKALMSAVRKGKTPTLGTRRTDAQKAYMKQCWAERKPFMNLLSPEERAARAHTRNICKRFLRRVLTMARVRKDLPTERLMGYSKQTLRAHLEAQFTGDMSWLNRESFHIDHIKPCAAFFAEGVFDPAIINALSNLQVLTPAANRAKSNIYTKGVCDVA
jgi:transposase